MDETEIVSKLAPWIKYMVPFIVFFALVGLLIVLRGRTGDKYEVKTADIVLALVPVALWLMVTGQLEDLTMGPIKMSFQNAAEDDVGAQVRKLPINHMMAEQTSTSGEVPEGRSENTDMREPSGYRPTLPSNRPFPGSSGPGLTNDIGGTGANPPPEADNDFEDHDGDEETEDGSGEPQGMPESPPSLRELPENLHGRALLNKRELLNTRALLKSLRQTSEDSEDRPEVIFEEIGKPAEGVVYQWSEEPHYSKKTIKTFLKLARNLRYMVIRKEDGTFFGMFHARHLLVLRDRKDLTLQELTNRINNSQLDDLAEIDGFIGEETRIKSETKRRTALKKMKKYNLNTLPVVDSDGKFVGVIHKLDIVTSFVSDMVAEAE